MTGLANVNVQFKIVTVYPAEVYGEFEMKLHALIVSTLDSDEFFIFPRRPLHTRRERQSVFIKIVRFYVRNPTGRHAFWLVSIFPLSRIVQSGLFEFSIDSETLNLDDVTGFYKILFDNFKGRNHFGDLIVDESTLFH